MKSSISKLRFACAGLILVCCGAIVSAQSAKDSFVIYAKAGRVNLVSGSAKAHPAAGGTEKVLAVSDELQNGDIVNTGADARLEVLLSPGSFLRVADNTEFRMESTNLEDIRFELKRGSAVIETGGGPDDVLRIAVDLPAGEVVIDRRGVYRLNVDGARNALLVINGRATIQPAMIEVKEGRSWVANGSAAEPVAKFDKKAKRDALDAWSRERAEYLAKANRSLDNRQVANSYDGFNAFNNFDLITRFSGFWLFSSRRGYCMFVPFDPWSWQSAYGYNYSVGYYWNRDIRNPFEGNPRTDPTIVTPTKVNDIGPPPAGPVRTGGTKPAH
jgi:hypothetical protein